MAILKNTLITGTGSLTLPAAPTARRTESTTTVQSFTTVGSTTWVCPSGVNSIEVLVVAGGGGGGGGFNSWAGGGGGGAGGLIYRNNYAVTPSTSYAVTVGAGGAGQIGSTSPRYGFSGGNSVFDTLTAIGGGGGNSWNSSTGSTAPAGGSGGGGQNSSGPFTGALGTAGQGNNGGNGMAYTNTNASSAGGGGGAGSPGGEPATNQGGGGGEGIRSSISGTLSVYAAGGGGGGGTHGGGSQNGGRGGNGSGGNGVNATANTGGGGGGAGSTVDPNSSTSGGSGGSGIVIIRYQVTADASSTDGIVRYNTDLSDVEVYDGVVTKWIAQDQSKNYAGHNLIINSQDFTALGWNKSGTTITSNTTTAPDGTVTASKLVESVGGTVHYIDQARVFTTGIHTYSIYVKAAERSHLMLRFYADNSVFTSGVVWFNLSTGVVGFTSASITASIQNIGNGWYRIEATATANAAATGYIGLYMSDVMGTTNASPSYSGNGSNGMFIWGGQIEKDVQSPGPYTRTDNAPAPQPISLGGYRIHSYTNTGTCSFVPALTGTVEVLVVAGGGGAGTDVGGGGGGGGVVYNASYPVISGTRYKVTVGAGGGAGAGFVGGSGANGEDSQFGSIVAIGGGGGGYYYSRMGYNGGSGGGQGGTGPNNTPAVAGTSFAGSGTIGQGHGGGIYRAGALGGGGGGGAGGPGFNQWGYGADGGPGVGYDISGTMTFYGGGGGAGDSGSTAQVGHGGIGGGGDGDSRNLNTPNLQINGQANTGGGGGADGGFTQSGSGGSGIVIVRYRHN